MSEQDTGINYLALALVLKHSRNDHDLLKNARRATTILQSSDKSIADGHSYHAERMQEFSNDREIRQPNQREV